MEVGSQVGRAGVVGSVNLRAKRGVEGKGEDNFCRALAHKLLRVLDGRRPYPIIVEMISSPEIGRAGVVEAYVSLGILAIGEGQIGRVRRNAHSIWRLQAPGLSAQELPLAPLQIQPVEAHTVGVAIGTDKHVA